MKGKPTTDSKRYRRTSYSCLCHHRRKVFPWSNVRLFQSRLSWALRGKWRDNRFLRNFRQECSVGSVIPEMLRLEGDDQIRLLIQNSNEPHKAEGPSWVHNWVWWDLYLSLASRRSPLSQWDWHAARCVGSKGDMLSASCGPYANNLVSKVPMVTVSASTYQQYWSLKRRCNIGSGRTWWSSNLKTRCFGCWNKLMIREIRSQGRYQD